MTRFLGLLAAVLILTGPVRASAAPLQVATFEVDVTPPLGTPLCDALVQPAREVIDLLTARGIVLLTDDKPIVLCAVDWVGVGNSGHDAFREAIARAAGTSRERVCVHCLHQHDAPGCDFEADEILAKYRLGGKLFNAEFARLAIGRVADAVKESLKRPRKVTHVGFGKAMVEKVASARRVLGDDGKVKWTRYSTTLDAKVRAEPEGLIDPYVQLLGFWDEDRPVVSITYYATHPQCNYGKGLVSCDFPGLARNRRQRDVPEAAHIHFNGAGGNITAGKYNDGDPINRAFLAERLARGMTEAFDKATKVPVNRADVSWQVVSVVLPLSPAYDVKSLIAEVADDDVALGKRLAAARTLVWAKRCEREEKVDIACLRVGPGFVLHMPGELFVEYQLAAQQMRPKSPVLMAAYGDYGPGYIGTAIAYKQGGYETGPASRVAPEVEEVLMGAMKDLLK